MKRHSKKINKNVNVIVLSVIVLILVIIIIIAFNTRNHQLANNKIVGNIITQLRLLSYIFSSIGALSIVFAVLKYQQSKSSNLQRRVKNSLGLLDYFLTISNVNLTKIRNLVNREYQSSIERLKIRYFKKFHGYLKITKTTKHIEYRYLLSKLLKNPRMVSMLNNLEYWADCVNEGSKYHFINETNLYKELYDLIVPALRLLLSNPKLSRHSMPECYELVNRWLEWHNNSVN